MIARSLETIAPEIIRRELLDMRLLTFVVRADGSIEVASPWFTAVRLDPAALMVAEGRGCARREGDRVLFQCANGGAEYQITGETEGRLDARFVREWE